MPDDKEALVRKMDWGDGKQITVPKPKLEYIPGESVICPTPCNPVGEDEQEWKKNEEATR